jgi:L-cysteine S-thiosulfotransferase
MRGRIALAGTLVLVVLSAPLGAQQSTLDGLQLYREMSAEDNPGELWVERGKALFHRKSGPKNASLEQCDFGLGPGQLKGAFAQLPRYFPDTDKVQDLESRLLTCIVTLQGLNEADVKRSAFSTLDRNSDMEALAAYVASESNGMTFGIKLDHPKEKMAYATGEKLFFRRNGPLDFACATCHAEDGKRIRLQDLPNMQDAKQIQAILGGWPAYRGTQSTVRTMQHRLFDCNWQMRLPPLEYASDFSIALETYLVHRANGGPISAPGVRR